MPNIFELFNSREIAAYWETMVKDRKPYVGQTLFPDQQKLGLSLNWIKGSNGLPVVLRNSAFDAKALPRTRMGFEKLQTQMPFFKESMYIEEELRQEFNMVLETGIQAYIDAVANRIFKDEMTLIEAAEAARERMRMMLLTTGVIAMKSNGQDFHYDYGIPSSHKSTVTNSWDNPATSTPIDDIRAAQDKIQDDTGTRPTKAICNRKTWRDLMASEQIKKSIFVLTNGQVTLNDARLKAYLMDELELDVIVNDKRYKDEDEATQKYVPDDVFTLFPEGQLGSTWFGTTPEQSDLMVGSTANVSLVDTGVAITTTKETDPVNVNTKVTMICLPSFEAANEVYILDTKN